MLQAALVIAPAKTTFGSATVPARPPEDALKMPSTRLALLNKMRVKRKGGIINVASASGYLPVPKWSVYAASKAYVLHFTEALWYEFKASGIDILALCPGATNTGFGGNVDQQKGMDVGDVVKTALESLSRKPSVIAGRKNRLITLGLKLLSRKALINLGARIVRQ